MNSRIIIALAFLAGALGLGGKEKSPPSKPEPEPSRDNPPSDAFFASPAGYRRAGQGEVTPAMSADAHRALKLNLGDFIKGDGYAVFVESHFNTTKGWHKGASVFLRTT
jgi:hypothetical protein